MELMEYKWVTDGEYAIASGRVRNISNKPMKSVETYVTWTDKKRKFIVANGSLIDYNPILSGQVSPFKVIEKSDLSMNYALFDFKKLNGGSINWRKQEGN